MTIDIEGLIKEIDKDGSGEIEFEEFKMLLKSGFVNEGNWNNFVDKVKFDEEWYIFYSIYLM